MPKRKITKTLKGEQLEQLKSFKSVAFHDYLAARTLLRHNLLLQGCFQACTSIEKYLKAILIFIGTDIPHHHDITASRILNPIRNYDLPLYNKINLDFLNFLNKTYIMRYPEEVEEGFNLVIIKEKH